MEPLLALFREEPIGSLVLLLAITLTVPPLCDRLRLPGVLGLLMAGVVLGPQSLGLLSAESPIMALLADVGLLYLMFVAGIEIDLAQLRKVKYRSMGFGALTFTCPLVAGIVLGRVFGFDWNPAVLLGSLLASHSLMTYPIVRRLGVVANEAVTVTIGATICTDIGALVVLAICLGVNGGDFTGPKLLWLLFSLAVYTLVVLVGIDRIGRDFFRRSGGDEGNQFLFVLLAVFLAALGAQLIGVEKIVGAFLSGLAVNDVIRDGPVKEKVVFVGSVLFIPIFFVTIGLRMDLSAFLSSGSAMVLAIAIVLTLMGSKFLAALLAKLSFGYSLREMLTMWSMSIPQVATTLAATLVGNQAGMLSDDVLNSVVVMMLVTATLGPLIVSRAALGLPLPPALLRSETDAALSLRQPRDDRFTVLVPIQNPATESALIELAARLAQQQNGEIIPLAITLARPGMSRPQLAQALDHSEALLAEAEALGEGFGVPVRSRLRVDDQVPLAIYRASQEQRADLIVMGWGETTSLRARLLGNVVDSVFGAAPCPVMVARLVPPLAGSLAGSLANCRRILVPIENFSGRSGRIAVFAQLLGSALGAELTLFHVLPATLGETDPSWAEGEMAALVARSQLPREVAVQIVVGEVVEAIAQAAPAFDLVLFHSQRQQAAAEGFSFSSLTSQLLTQVKISVIILGEAAQG